MKKKLPLSFIILVFVAGVCVLIYPLVSSVVNNVVSRSNAKDYTGIVKQQSSQETQEMLIGAQKYNNSLTGNLIITDPFDEEAYEKIGSGYEQALNVDGNGLIGYLEIPKINVYLPINHGTTSEVLDKSAGHLQNTSLPVGGESTHSVISAHSAYPSQTFFDYLPDLKVGDEFFVHVLDRNLKYEVDQIKTVLPEQTEDFRIVRGEDHVTLVTCTPYSINTHRLLVRGKRVDYDDSQYVEVGAKSLDMSQDGIFFLGYKIPYSAAAIAIASIIAVVIIVVALFVRKNRKKAQISKKNQASNTNSKGGADE